MGGCAAPSCKNRLGFRLFIFPKDEERKKVWLSNAELDFVGPHARLCQAHFHDSQFEQQRQDGWKKLKHNAIPTIFNEPIRVYRIKKNEAQPSELIEIVTNVHQERKSKRLANKSQNKDDVPKKKCKGRTTDELSEDESICSQLSNSEVPEMNLIESKDNNHRERSILDNIKDKNVSLLDDIKRIHVSVKHIQPKTCLKGNKDFENASLTAAKGNKLIVLLKQWNAVLKSELEDLEQLHETVSISNEILQQDAQELEKTNQTLKSENNKMQDEVNEFDKRNKEMYLVINELEKHNKILSDKLNDLKPQNVENEMSLNKKNKLLDSQKEELESSIEIMVEENTAMLEEIQEFVKNNQVMSEVILQLEKHNHAISCKLKDVEDENRNMSIKMKEMDKVIHKLKHKVHKYKKKQKHHGTNVKKKCLVESAYPR